MEEEDKCDVSSGSGSEGEEGEEGSEDEQSHQQLLDKMDSLTKRSRVRQRTEGAAVTSEYHLPPVQQDLSVQSLLSGLGRVDNKSLLALRKRLGAVTERVEPLDTPLNKIQADKANRIAANEESCKQVGKWAPIIKKNREAEHLSFPLQEERVPAQSLATKLDSFKPHTSMEKKVAAILAASEHSGEAVTEEGLTDAEKKTLFQMTVEEAMERKKALQRHRALVMMQEQKCRRVNRIKSKKFHKIQRKRLEKLTGGKQLSEEELVKLRAVERMTLKHSSKGKWAKKQHIREHRDPATQQALSEHHNKKLQLTQKSVQQEEEEEDNVSEEEEANTLVEERQTTSRDTNNPWLNSTSMKKRCAAGSGSGAGKVIDTSSFMKSGEEDKGRLGAASDQLLAVREAFAGDNVVEEFEREKAELEAQELAKDEPVVLPGWGRWGGEGVKPSKKPVKTKPRPPRKPRADDGLKHVIISEEKSNKKMLPHLVQSVPWPYTSKEQFDLTNRTPIGRHWNSEACFNQMIKPRISTKVGTFISPIRQ